ncbi:type VII toxin-antitoxin system MntA family adenylyltransferase antitoxin, partial [Candidatus Hakubella thermalkaliphila]
MNEPDLKRLADYLSKYPVIMAYLFGSEAKSKAGPLSDVDIAVFIDKGIDKSGRFDLRLRLSNELSSIMGRRVDLVILNDTPVQLSFEIIKGGELVLCRCQSTKVDVEKEILLKFRD